MNLTHVGAANTFNGLLLENLVLCFWYSVPRNFPIWQPNYVCKLYIFIWKQVLWKEYESVTSSLLKGLDSEKNSLCEKVPQTLHSNKL